MSTPTRRAPLRVKYHADLALTLRVYAHAMRENEADFSFADFDGPSRPYAARDEFGVAEDAAKPAERLALGPV